MGADKRPATAVRGPTRMPTEADAPVIRWVARPTLARAIKLVLFAMPSVAAILMGLVASAYLPPEKLGINPWLWSGLLIVVAAVTVRVFLRIAGRLLPIGALYRLNLVFPDEAPSRFMVALRTGSSRSLERRIREVQESGVALSDPDAYAAQMLELVAMLSKHDRLTRGHSERVRAYTDLIIAELGLHQRDADRLRWAGLLHDLGKLMVPAEILNKKGRPDDQEWEIVETHPAEGLRLAEPLAGWLGDWLETIGQHHERWDGNGYPNALAATDIHLGARIVAVADAYDVMTSARSYKPPQPVHVAVEEIARCSGTQFDPMVVRAFLRIGLAPLRRVTGPLAWFASLPAVRSLGLIRMAGSAAATAASTLAAVAGITGLGFLPIGDAGPSPPVLESRTIYVVEDQEQVFSLSAHGGDKVVLSMATDPLHGTASLEEIATITGPAGTTRVEHSVRYAPNRDYFGPDHFEVMACAAPELCVAATIAVDVLPVNDPPQAFPDALTVQAGGSATTADLRGNDIDPEGRF